MAERVAIIGAGIAGLATAHRLRAAGLACTLFDKGRRIGGRMATRQAGDLAFDHGAQYFTAKGPSFSAMVARWRAAGLAAEWFAGAFVGTASMAAPLAAMAAGFPCIGARAATALRRDSAGWTVLGAEGPFEAADNGRFDAVVLAMPAPQIVPLAATAGLAFPALTAVRYAPCWALMLAYDAPPGPAYDHLRPEDEAIGWIARDAAKPGRDREAETWVVHAAPAWSRRHLELAPEAAGAALRAEAARFGLGAAPRVAIAHRWRFARVEQAAAVPFVWDAAAGLGACGDWGLGPRVEAAFDSGEALAAAMLAAPR